MQDRGAGNAQVEALGRKMLELVGTQPEVATALNAMLDAMLSQTPDENQAGVRANIHKVE